MAEAELKILGDRSTFEPGEKVEVLARWSTIREPDYVEIRVVWHTEGKGNRDLEVVQTVQLPRVKNGEHQQSIVLPTQPVSYSGTLISVVWGIELVIPSAKKSARVDIVIGVNGQALEPREPRFART